MFLVTGLMVMSCSSLSSTVPPADDLLHLTVAGGLASTKHLRLTASSPSSSIIGEASDRMETVGASVNNCRVRNKHSTTPFTPLTGRQDVLHYTAQLGKLVKLTMYVESGGDTERRDEGIVD